MTENIDHPEQQHLDTDHCSSTEMSQIRQTALDNSGVFSGRWHVFIDQPGMAK
jgi:hypothetical protein